MSTATETPRQVQLRQDLQHSRQLHQGKSYLVVKDPLTRRYFRFTETQAAILELLAQPTDAETVAAIASRTLGAVTSATISAFFDSLEAKNLLDTPKVRERLGTTGGPNKLKQSSILYKQVASFNPERIFDWLLPRTRWAFKPAFHVFGCFLILCGVTIFFLNWKDLQSATPNLLNIWTVLMVWPIVFAVSAYHEFSHGITCRHFGGQVTEVGFMLIYFSPAFYCDVSDAWMFPNRRQRMFVTLAGGYSQLILWGLCTILWWITEPDTIINQVMVVVVLFSGLQTLFNFNPLIKLDGYYMLSDYLEIPNLRSKAFGTLWNWLTLSAKRKTFREDRSQLIYGVCAFAFSSTLLVTVYSAIYAWATEKWATAGLVGFAIFSTITLRRTAVESMSGLKTLLSWVISRKIRNTLIVLTALLLTIFVELELKIPADFEVLPQQEFTVRAETAGVLIEISENVREGKRISKGELLARTQDFEKESAADRIAGDIRTRTATLEKLLAEPRQVDINALQSRITEKTVELDNVKKNQQERRVLEETLAQDKTKLGQLQYEAATKKQGFEDGVYAEIIWREAQNKVEVQQHLIQQHEAAIKALDQNTDRQSDLVLTQLEALRTDMVRLKAGPGPQAIREIQSEIDKLKSQLKVLNQEVKKSEIRALIDGTVATPFPERKLYEKLNAGAEFIKLVDTEVVTIEMHVPEKELADIENAKDDLVVRLRARSYPDEYFEGHVRKSQIAPIAQAVNGQKMIAIRTHLPNESGKLKPGMTGKGGIYCGKRRIIYIMTRRMIRWIKVDFLNLLPW